MLLRKSLVSIRHRAIASMIINNYEDALTDYLKVLNETEDWHKCDTSTSMLVLHIGFLVNT